MGRTSNVLHDQHQGVVRVEHFNQLDNVGVRDAFEDIHLPVPTQNTGALSVRQAEQAQEKCRTGHSTFLNSFIKAQHDSAHLCLSRDGQKCKRTS